MKKVKQRSIEEKYRNLVEGLQEGIWVVDENAVTTFVNPRLADMLGYTVNEMLGLNIVDFVDERHVELATATLARRKQGIKEQYDFEFRRKDGSTLFASLEAVPQYDDTGRFCGSMAAVADIANRKKTEERLRAALAEKESLLREIHHRVKNNMQVIISLLNLQSQQLQDHTAKDIIKETQSRIRSMAIIHEKLHQSQSLSRIDFSEYIRSLTAHLFRFYGIDVTRISLRLDMEAVYFEINTSIPLGLIVNELVTNALKHAFPSDAAAGEVAVSLRQADEKNGMKYLLEVRDSGVGVPESLDFRNTQSLGMQIVMMLVQQLDAEIELDRSAGTTFRIRFNELKYNIRF